MNLPGIGDPIALSRAIAAQGLIHFPNSDQVAQEVKRAKYQSKREEVQRIISDANGMTLREWVGTEAARCGVSVEAIYNRVKRGKYPDMKLVGGRRDRVIALK